MPSSTSSSEERSARRAVWALAAVFALLVALALGLWLAMPLSPVSQQRYLAAVDDHLAMLERSKGKADRVVLIGGSGVAFSISAEDLTDTLDRPVFNGGIQAGIGYRNLIDLYSDRLDPAHDTIVLVPELELLAGDARYSEVWCDVVFLRKAAGDLARQPRCVPNILHRTWQEVRHHASGAQVSDRIYRRSGFNAFGDMTAHLSVDRPAPDLRDYRAPELDDATLSRFEDFVQDRFIGRGFAVLYIPSAMPEKACRAHPDRLQGVIDRLSALSTIDVPAYDLERFCFSHDLFFDGAAHLDRDGRAIQTQNVRRALASAVAKRRAN